jgi:hypothetical protein
VPPLSSSRGTTLRDGGGLLDRGIVGGSCALTSPSCRSRLQIWRRSHSCTWIWAKSLESSCTGCRRFTFLLMYADCRHDGLQYRAGRPVRASLKRCPHCAHFFWVRFAIDENIAPEGGAHSVSAARGPVAWIAHGRANPRRRGNTCRERLAVSPGGEYPVWAAGAASLLRQSAPVVGHSRAGSVRHERGRKIPGLVIAGRVRRVEQSVHGVTARHAPFPDEPWASSLSCAQGPHRFSRGIRCPGALGTPKCLISSTPHFRWRIRPFAAERLSSCPAGLLLGFAATG